MTASAEAGIFDRPSRPPFGPAWRDAMAVRQRDALPHGEVTVSCSAPLGTGGLGRHLGEILDALERAGSEVRCVCGSTRGAHDPALRHRHGLPYLADVLARVRVPVSPAVRTRAFMVEFDDYAARRLTGEGHVIAFNGQALAQARVARAAKHASFGLVSANSHMRQVIRQQERARRQYPVESSWAAHMLARSLAEYAYADRIYVASRYIRESFLDAGFAEETLVEFPLTPAPRYTPAAERVQPEHFEVVYIGSLSVHKGVPLLIDAVSRLPHRDLRLKLIGSWATRGMRRHVEAACARDRRISLEPGDPLPHLREAAVCVHPAYEDGFAYAPAEALASGVPVIVSEDTGMKDLIESPSSGLVLPTGDVDALARALDAAYRRELFA